MKGETYRERAPLLPPDALTEIVFGDLLAPELVEHVEAVYVYGSFADPDRELDRDGDVSDLDLYVVMEREAAGEFLPTGEGPGAGEVSTRFGATQHGLLCRLATQGAITVYGRDEPLGVTLPDAPEPVVESLVRAERAVFHASGFDVELLQFRPTDLTLGTRDVFDQFVGDDPHLQVWAADWGRQEGR